MPSSSSVLLLNYFQLPLYVLIICNPGNTFQVIEVLLLIISKIYKVYRAVQSLTLNWTVVVVVILLAFLVVVTLDYLTLLLWTLYNIC